MLRLWALGFAALGCGCAATVPEVHAQAVSEHLRGLEREAQRIAQDAPRHARCQQGETSLATQAQEVHRDLATLAREADGNKNGTWKSKDAFQDALDEAAELQTKLVLTRAQYDQCRALSTEALDPEGLRWAPGTKRVAVLGLLDPSGVLDRPQRAEMSAFVRARLSASMALVPEDAMLDATIDRRASERCDRGCAIEVAQTVGAHKALVVTLAPAEGRCVIILELHDLATQLTERARTVRNDCGSESILAGLEDALTPFGE